MRAAQTGQHAALPKPKSRAPRDAGRSRENGAVARGPTRQPRHGGPTRDGAERIRTRPDPALWPRTGPRLARSAPELAERTANLHRLQPSMQLPQAGVDMDRAEAVPGAQAVAARSPGEAPPPPWTAHDTRRDRQTRERTLTVRRLSSPYADSCRRLSPARSWHTVYGHRRRHVRTTDHEALTHSLLARTSRRGLTTCVRSSSPGYRVGETDSPPGQVAVAARHRARRSSNKHKSPARQ